MCLGTAFLSTCRVSELSCLGFALSAANSCASINFQVVGMHACKSPSMLELLELEKVVHVPTSEVDFEVL